MSQKTRIFCMGILILAILSFRFLGVLKVKEKEISNTIVVTDSLGHEVRIPYPLTSVAVINPYNAELITAVGAEKAITGIDKDIYENREAFPVEFTKNMIVCGHGEHNIDYEKVIRLKPQLLILDGGMYYEHAKEILDLFGIQVMVLRSDSPYRFEENCKLLGHIFGKEEKAKELAEYYIKLSKYVDSQLKEIPKKRVYYECRRFARSVIPGEQFNEMLDFAHAENIFSDSNSIYVSPEYIVLRKPEYIVKLSDINAQYSIVPPTPEEYYRIENELKERPCWKYMQAIENNKLFFYSYYSHGGAGKIIGALFLAKYMYPEHLKDLDPENAFRYWVEHFERVSYKKGHTYHT